MSKYILEADEEQLQFMAKALEFYSRLQMGQISELTNPYMIVLPNADYSDVDDKIKALKSSMFPDMPINGCYSIKSKQIPDTVRQMIDMHEAITYKLVTDINPDRINDENIKPYHWSSEKELLKITKVDDANS